VRGRRDVDCRHKAICENHQSMFAFGGKAGILNYTTTASAGPIVSAQLTH
jgi:hypothetical protein